MKSIILTFALLASSVAFSHADFRISFGSGYGHYGYRSYGYPGVVYRRPYYGYRPYGYTSSAYRYGYGYGVPCPPYARTTVVRRSVQPVVRVTSTRQARIERRLDRRAERRSR